MCFKWKCLLMMFWVLASLFLSGCDWVKNEENVTQAKQGSVEQKETSVNNETDIKIQSLTLRIDKTSLKKEENSTVEVMATMSDGSQKNVTEDVVWEVTPKEAVLIDKWKLTAKKDLPTRLKAKIGSVESNIVSLVITWEINGHILPPEPDPKVNNATLLGVDVNDNGVRDDVERWIIIYYNKDPEYPKTKIAIALQYAWASQKILESPTMKSKKYIDDALDCQRYWAWKKMKENTQGLSGFEQGKYYSKLTFLTDHILKDKIYNTKERINQKFSFNEALSGNIFDSRKESLDNCRTNIDILGE